MALKISEIIGRSKRINTFRDQPLVPAEILYENISKPNIELLLSRLRQEYDSLTLMAQKYSQAATNNNAKWEETCETLDLFILKVEQVTGLLSAINQVALKQPEQIKLIEAQGDLIRQVIVEIEPLQKTMLDEFKNLKGTLNRQRQVRKSAKEFAKK